LFWKWKSRQRNDQPRISAETIALIRWMAEENPLWGAERMHGELLKPPAAGGKPGFSIAKRSIQRYIGHTPAPREPSQTWSTFLKTHARDVWACDFVPVIDLLFRQLFVFFIVELESRRVVHFAVTRHPSQFWTAQQLREATSDSQSPRYVLRDNDSKYGSAFDIVAKATGIEVLRMPIKAPRANAIVERYIGSVRRECLDHMLISGERQLYRVITAYVAYFNRSRPHQGIGQNVPYGPPRPKGVPFTGTIISLPVLHGLDYEYRRAA
jgi:transposase InsO family protein